MKIIHVVEPFSSGITTFIIHLVNGMPEHENIVIHGKRAGSDSIEKVKGRFNDSTQFITWENAKREINIWNDIKAGIELWRILKKLKPDVIHLHSSKAGFLGRLASVFSSTKIIYTPNGLSFARKDVSRWTKKFYIWLEMFANAASGKIICCSKSEYELLSDYGIKSDYINNGTIIRANDSYVKRNKGLVITIGCLALITEQKDPESFNRIAEHFESNERLRFVWIGDGHLRNTLQSKNIEVTGWLDSSEKEESFSSLDIYLSCSLWEGLPFSVLEAMNNNKCLILKNCVGNVDLVENEINGFGFDSIKEAILKIEYLIKNEEKIESFGNASFEILKANFNVENMVKSYKERYELDA